MIEIYPFIGYRCNLMLIVNERNPFGARLGKKFINLEPDSVKPSFPNTVYEG